MAPYAYVGSVTDSATIRADGRIFSQTTEYIFEAARLFFEALQTSLAAPEDFFLPPSDPKALSGLPESTQTLYRPRACEIQPE